MQPDAFFCGPGLDRADLLRARPDTLAELAARKDARELDWRDGVPALDESGRLQWRPVRDPSLFLGLEDGAPRFSPVVDAAASAFSVMPLLAGLDAADAPLFAAATSLARWHARHGFCASCGHATAIARGGWSRSCAGCAAEHFPRVDPVVIMLAEHEGKLLLGRQPHFPPGRYTALAGFVEVGESIEAAVARELHEEAGVAAVDVRYVASQPWPFPSSLMIGCHAHALEGELTIDTTELEDARWFSRDEVAAAMARAPDAAFQPPPRTAIARTLMEHWLDA